MIGFSRTAPVILGLIVFRAAIAPAHGQKEFPPPQGKGRVVVVVSGAAGEGRYEAVAAQIAQLGYDTVLFDFHDLKGNEDAALRAAVQQARQMPHALPGKVGLIGFSAGGGIVLQYGSQMFDIASVVIAWYPVTRFVSGEPDFVGKLRLPVLMLAGEADAQRGCCLIETARALAAAAASRQFELVTYPNTQHQFIYGGSHYNPQAYADAMQRTAAKLAQYLDR